MNVMYQPTTGTDLYKPTIGCMNISKFKQWIGTIPVDSNLPIVDSWKGAIWHKEEAGELFFTGTYPDHPSEWVSDPIVEVVAAFVTHHPENPKAHYKSGGVVDGIKIPHSVVKLRSGHFAYAFTPWMSLPKSGWISKGIDTKNAEHSSVWFPLTSGSYKSGRNEGQSYEGRLHLVIADKEI